jgi:hypothetical protein
MSNLSSRVPEATVNAIARRTARLIDLVERATQASPHKQVREGGAQLIDLLGERIEEIRELHAMDDEDLPDRIKGFKLRLSLAEEKVLTWKLPKTRKPSITPGARSPRTRRPSKREKTAA